MVQFFLEHGANPNATSNYRETPLHLTLRKSVQGTHPDYWSDTIYRIEYMPDILADEADGKADKAYEIVTKQQLACHGKDYASVAVLLSHGTDILHTDKNGLNSLHWAARSTNVKTMSRILEAANTNCFDVCASVDGGGRNAELVDKNPVGKDLAIYTLGSLTRVVDFPPNWQGHNLRTNSLLVAPNHFVPGLK
jgi:hypothetical protein